MVRVQQKSTRQNHRYRRIIRPSLRNGFNGFLRALPGDHCLVATVARETRERLHDLSACVGAPEPHDFAVRCSIIRPRKKLRLTLPRPSHPIPNVRDDREPPLYGERDERKKATDLGVRSMRETATDWHDGQITLVWHALCVAPRSSFRGDAPASSPESISPPSKWPNGFRARAKRRVPE